MIATTNQKINQLAGVTYNNLACYYKKYIALDEEPRSPKLLWPTSRRVWNCRCSRLTIGCLQAAPISIYAPSTPTSTSILPPIKARISHQPREPRIIAVVEEGVQQVGQFGRRQILLEHQDALLLQ